MLYFQRCRDQDRSLRRQFVEVGETGETVAIGLVQKVVRREWRLHSTGLAGIGADRLAAPANDPLVEQIADRFGRWPRRMRTGFVGVQKAFFRTVSLVPVAAQNDPFAFLYLTVLGSRP